MCFRDHPPPHFHTPAYAGHVAPNDIETLGIIDGRLPERPLRKVTERGDELRENWDRARAQ